MALSQTYDPSAPQPYQPPALPDVAPIAVPSPIPAEAPQANGAVRPSGGVATIADGLLRGFMAGRAMHQAKQVMEFKKKDDNLQASYNSDAQRLYQLSQAGVDQNSPEFKQANAAVQGSWGALQDFRGQQIQGQKKKGKKQDAAPDPATLMARLHSQDPHEKAQALFELSQKAGPPVYGQIAVLNSPQAKARREQAQAQSQSATELAKAKVDYYDLGEKTDRTDEEEARYKQLGEMLSSAGATGKAAPVSNVRAVAGTNVTGSNLPKGAKDAYGNSLAEVPPDSVWKSMIRGNEVFYIPENPNQQLKVTAQPGSGLPEQTNYNPVTAKLDVPHPQGMAPVKTEYKNVTTTDRKGNPVTQIVPVSPGYKAPPGSTQAPAPDATSSPGPELHHRDGTPTAESDKPQTYTKHAKTPAEAEASKQIGKHINEQLKAAGGAKTPGYTFDKFSKDNQQAFRALQAQDLTINGKPGSKVDVGLKKATDDVMESKDPDLKKHIAVAMNALDSYSKASLGSHTDGDYSFVKLLGSSWNTIPSLNAAFSPLNDSPEGKVYLDNFFRAWTNAATIRALQGTTGRPTQSMYAMLVNELPMVGVNVNSKADADRKIALLQDDVDTAAGTLPDKLQATLKSGKARKDESADPTLPPQKIIDAMKDGQFVHGDDGSSFKKVKGKLVPVDEKGNEIPQNK